MEGSGVDLHTEKRQRALEPSGKTNKDYPVGLELPEETN
jgi:hypothetical protein